ncbi:MAG: hypothetical protein J6M55_06155 [Paludibacteraceae bacterium]|nr:hypothetical protein [Paludibacteraceae bacterium]
MKKIFLIPLMTLMCSVMAWGENVEIAQIGETTYYQGDAADTENHIYETAQLALNATIADVANEGTIKLLSSVEGSFVLGAGLNKTITLDVNGKTLSGASATALNINGGSKLVLINSDTSNEGYITSAGWTVLCQTNAELEINDGVNVQASGKNNTIYGFANSTITINGGTVKYIGTSNDPDLINCAGCTLTINGGRIENTTKWNAIYATNGAQVTINGGLITNTCSSNIQTYAVYFKGNTSNTTYDSKDSIKTTLNFNGGEIVCTASGRGNGITVLGKGAKLNMNGGSIHANSFAITGNGTSYNWGTTINIFGGTIGSSTTGVAIYHPQAGTLNITGGTITGQTGIGIKGGTLNISGGTIHAVGNNGGRVEGYNNGLHSSFAAVQIESNPGYAGNMNITVSNNATLISDSWYAFYEYLSNPDAASKVNSIAVSGGNFQGGILLSQSLNSKGGFVSGGKWTKDISANIKTGENLSLLNNEDDDNPPYLYLVGVPTSAQEADYAEITNQHNTTDPTQNNNAVLTNTASESAASSYTSDNVGNDPDAIDVITTKETNPVVVSENTDVVATEDAPIVEVKKITVDNDAQLIVTEGATLMVGTGSVLLDENTTTGGLTVEAGAALVVDGLVYGSTEDNFVIEGQEAKSGIVLFSPETEFIREDHPKATYRFTSKSFRDGSKWVYQRFGMPSVDGNVTVKSGNLAVNSYICTWDYATDDWGAWSPKIPEGGLVYAGEDKAVPFQCYQLGSTNAKDAPVTYDFVVELMGNANAPLNFKTGWNPYANSYTAPIDIKEFLTDVIANNGSDILATIYLYKDLGNDTYTWQGINLSNVGKTYRVRENGAMVKKTYDASIEPMQAFIMKLSNGEDATTDINYLNNVYNPAMGIERPAGAPARNRASYNEMQIGAYNDLYWDNISVMEGEQFSAAEDNGYDAPKYDHNKGLSLYVINGEQHMERVATDNADGMFIGINAPVAGTYTLDFSGIVGMDYSLIDMTNNTVVEIVEDGTYNFYAEAGQNDYRFQLVAPARIPTAIENVNAKASAKGVYSISGQYLGEDINALPKGVYIINGAKVVK